MGEVSLEFLGEQLALVLKGQGEFRASQAELRNEVTALRQDVAALREETAATRRVLIDAIVGLELRVARLETPRRPD